MGKKRIHELAKEMSLTSNELIQKILEWKLLPGVKLVASSGIEDYLANDIAKRLGQGVKSEESGAPQVVRRRKKAADGESAADAPAETAAAPASETATEKPDGQSLEDQGPDAPLPVRIKPKNFETATIVASASSLAKDSHKNVPAQVEAKIPSPSATPDFIKLVPVESVTEPVAAARTEKPAPAAPPSGVPAAAGPDGPAAEPRPAARTAESAAPAAHPTPRRVTRELGEPAKIISAPKPRTFESARVVGARPNWKDAKDAAPSGRPAGGPQGQGAGRPGGGQPFRPARPGEAAPGRFPRPAVEVPAPAADSDSRRRDAKKRKGHGHAGDGDGDSAGKGGARRREVVERTDLYSEGDWERVRRRGKGAKKLQAKTEITVPKAIKRRIKVDEAITVSELALRLAVKAGDIIKKLMGMGVLASLNQALDFDTASLVASEFGYEVDKSSFDEGDVLPVEVDQEAPRVARPPVVTIMGHVDHGKTSLLDYIRKANVQSGEAGGITQHIGAYHVSAGGRHITFLDTPGHEAFTAMRSRGAQVTDIVVLIVAADDGVMPQTREAADHARAAKVPIIVAVNKIDKPTANRDRIRRQMMEIGLTPEDLGGDTVFVEISAKTGQGVDELLDMILLQADILELKARDTGLARGRIIEARLDKGRGPVATVLVQEGLLKQGDTYVCGVFYGKIRALIDDQGQRVAEAGPAIPVEIQGISGVPQAGDEFIALADEKQARQVSQHRLLKQRESELTQTSKLTLENLFDNIKAGAVKGLNLVVKTDVQGSLEAIVDAVMKLSTPEMKINIIHQSTGAVSETDVMLASASNALVIGFGVRPAPKVSELAEAEHVQIRYYDIIYKLIDDIKEAMAGLLEPVRTEKVLGRAEVRQTFVVTKVGTIAGSYVTDGKIVRGAKARLLRDGVVVHDGRLSSLKRLKDDAREVVHGYECGIGFDNYNDVKIGDHIEAYQIEETAATVDLIDEAVARAASAAKERERERRREEEEE